MPDNRRVDVRFTGDTRDLQRAAGRARREMLDMGAAAQRASVAARALGGSMRATSADIKRAYERSSELGRIMRNVSRSLLLVSGGGSLFFSLRRLGRAFSEWAAESDKLADSMSKIVDIANSLGRTDFASLQAQQFAAGPLGITPQEFNQMQSDFQRGLGYGIIARPNQTRGFGILELDPHELARNAEKFTEAMAKLAEVGSNQDIRTVATLIFGRGSSVTATQLAAKWERYIEILKVVKDVQEQVGIGDAEIEQSIQLQLEAGIIARKGELERQKILLENADAYLRITQTIENLRTVHSRFLASLASHLHIIVPLFGALAVNLAAVIVVGTGAGVLKMLSHMRQMGTIARLVSSRWGARRRLGAGRGRGVVGRRHLRPIERGGASVPRHRGQLVRRTARSRRGRRGRGASSRNRVGTFDRALERAGSDAPRLCGAKRRNSCRVGPCDRCGVQRGRASS